MPRILRVRVEINDTINALFRFHFSEDKTTVHKCGSDTLIITLNESSVVLLYALFNSSDPKNAGLEAMRISLYDDSMIDNVSECGSAVRTMNVNFNLIVIR